MWCKVISRLHSGLPVGSNFLVLGSAAWQQTLPPEKIVDDALQLCIHQGNFRPGILGFCFGRTKLLL